MEASSVILMLGSILMLLLTYALIRGLCVSAVPDNNKMSTFRSLPRDLQFVIASIGILLLAIAIIGNAVGPPTSRTSETQHSGR